MKKLLLPIILIGAFLNIKAQNVDLSNYTDYIRVQKNGESGFSRAFGLNAYNHLYIGSVEKTIGDIYFYNSGVNHLMTLKPNGYVGIGTISPRETLEVNGSMILRGLNLDGKDITYLNNSRSILIGWNRSQGGGETNFISNRGAGAVGGFDFRDLNNSGVETTLIKIQGNGNVGIGTTNPGSWKLAVNGNIRAKEVKVETGWSDFVFENDYNLPTLEEVEQHIQEKGHLKDIPSAEEVTQNGIFLGEMNAKLLQKIEELTLYAIEQDKELKKQKEKNKELEERFTKLEQIINE